MLDTDNSESIEPILCGYFNKVIQALLGKIKVKMLKYILLKRNGDIFMKLLNCLQHHSLAQLLIELLQVKVITPSSHNNHYGRGGASGGLMSNNGRGFTFN